MHLDSFIKQTAGGQLVTIVKEHYVREDIECASIYLTFGQKASLAAVLQLHSKLLGAGRAVRWLSLIHI